MRPDAAGARRRAAAGGGRRQRRRRSPARISRRCTPLPIGAALAGAALGLGLAATPPLPALAASAPRCELVGAPTLVGRIRGDDGPTAGRVDARLGETVEVFARVPGRLDGARVIFADDGGRGHVSWSGAGCPPATLRWRRVEPRMEHVDTPAPNPGVALYANAVVFGPRHGAWIGHDHLEYVEAPIADADDRWTLTVDDARPSDPALASARAAEVQGLGVMRLTVEVSVDGEPPRRAPGAADAPRGAIADAVFRYTVRGGDDLFGWLTSFFNVPYVFGSAGVGARAQAERYVGADCADIIVAALRRAGRRDLAYTSVAGLIRALRVVAGPIELRPGGPLPSVDYTPLPGDILAIDYLGAAELPRPWDHVVIFAVDRGPDGAADGVLGPEDQVADIGDRRGLRFARLGDQGSVRVLALRGDAGRARRDMSK